MGRSPDDRVTAVVGKEICQREAIAAMLTGSIANMGSHYVVTLDATDCHSGAHLAREQVEAEKKEQVLRVVGAAASRLRRKLGESLSSIEKHDTPIEEATTSSLDALKAFSLGDAQRARGSDPASVPFYKRAIELDPNFAMAYATLAAVYTNMGESRLAPANAKKAFELRDRVSERERFYISSHYYNDTGELNKAIEQYQLWEQIYPRDWIPRNNLCSIYGVLGWFGPALQQGEKALELETNDPLPYTSLAGIYLALNRFDDAKAVSERQMKAGLEDVLAHGTLYTVAFIKGDASAMEAHANWGKGGPDEVYLLSMRAAPAAQSGRLKEARRLWHQSEELAQRLSFPQIAALMTATEAEWLAEFGFLQEAQVRARAARAIAPGPNVDSLVADALASGATSDAESLANQLEKDHPLDTLVKSVWVPIARSRIQLQRGAAPQAVAALESATPYELGALWQAIPFRAIYVRGLAFLRMKNGQKAAAEFRKILDHRGVDALSPYHALARLGLARASALAGATADSRRAYQEFFAFWNDADPDLPILQRARSEYQHLPSPIVQSHITGGFRDWVPGPLAPLAQNCRHDPWIAAPMQDGDHREWSFIGRVGDHIISHRVKSQRA
jgi:tetratricopeptide (TPR) repeat protein